MVYPNKSKITSIFRKGKFTKKIMQMEKGNALSDRQISSEVEKVISDDREWLKDLKTFL